jgi:hypothetical protein
MLMSPESATARMMWFACVATVMPVSALLPSCALFDDGVRAAGDADGDRAFVRRCDQLACGGGEVEGEVALAGGAGATLPGEPLIEASALCSLIWRRMPAGVLIW